MTRYNRLSKYLLADPNGVEIDLKKSHGSFIVDKGIKKLDLFSQYASSPVGWNHPILIERKNEIADICHYSIANSDTYTEEMVNFVEKFASILSDFKHFFFIEGGSAAVENSIKASIDYSIKKNNWNEKDNIDILHLKSCFHGRGGYTLSLTNTSPEKTALFPKFNWTRIINPSIGANTLENEELSLSQAKEAMTKNKVSCFIFENPQSEGGDNHFRDQWLINMRNLCNEFNVLMIQDEVQSGMGISGKWWNYQNTENFKPDFIVFGKKTQVCGFASSDKIDVVKNNVFNEQSRINSTFGGNLCGMVRCGIFIDIIKSENLIENAKNNGNYFLQKLQELELKNVRGKGLLLAFDVENRDDFIEKLSKKVLVLKSGKTSVRLRPYLDINKNEIDLAIKYIKECL